MTNNNASFSGAFETTRGRKGLGALAQRRLISKGATSRRAIGAPSDRCSMTGAPRASNGAASAGYCSHQRSPPTGALSHPWLTSRRANLLGSGQSAVVGLFAARAIIYLFGVRDRFVPALIRKYHQKKCKHNKAHQQQKVPHLTPPLLQSVLGKLAVVLGNLDHGLSGSDTFSAAARVSPACVFANVPSRGVGVHVLSAPFPGLKRSSLARPR